jgi:hypothetical protein
LLYRLQLAPEKLLLLGIGSDIPTEWNRGIGTNFLFC